MVWDEIDVGKAKVILLEIKEILDRNKIPFWLDLGTLLGAIREKKFVDGDSDIDFAAWDLHQDKFLPVMKEFYENGYDVSFEYAGMSLDKDGIHTSLNLFHKDEYTQFAMQQGTYFFNKNIATRLMFYFVFHAPLSSKHIIHHSESKHSFKENIINAVNTIVCNLPKFLKKNLYKSSYQIFRFAGGINVQSSIPLDYMIPFKPIQFFSKEFFVPNKPEELLAYFYGDDWRVPKKYFNLTPDSKYPYISFKETYFENLLFCPNCKRFMPIRTPHKKGDGKPPILEETVKCNQCGKEWKEKFFVTGIIEKKYVSGYPIRQMPDRQQAAEDLKMFNQFCKRHNIFFWLDGGTLLGAVRNGTFIPWEGDIDLATKKENLDTIYQNRVEFEQLGYKIFPKQQGYAIIGKNLSSKLDIFSYTFDDDSAHLYDVERNAIGNLSEFLIFVFNQYDADYKYETTVSVNVTKKFVKLISYIPDSIRKKTLSFLEKLFWSFGVAGTTISDTPKEFFSKFKEIKFYDDVFNVPYETEKYLIAVYGTDWKQPKVYSNDKSDSLYKWKAFKNVKVE